jgi:hypothetical protein
LFAAQDQMRQGCWMLDAVQPPLSCSCQTHDNQYVTAGESVPYHAGVLVFMATKRRLHSSAPSSAAMPRLTESRQSDRLLKPGETSAQSFCCNIAETCVAHNCVQMPACALIAFAICGCVIATAS